MIFTGSGATGAVDKLIGVLGLRIPSAFDDQYHFSDQIPPGQRPVVFVGPYEHHSNEVSWRETIADVMEVAADGHGYVDLVDLERLLLEYADRPLRIGSFSAASNVTGILTDTDTIARVLTERSPFPLRRRRAIRGHRDGRRARTSWTSDVVRRSWSSNDVRPSTWLIASVKSPCRDCEYRKCSFSTTCARRRSAQAATGPLPGVGAHRVGALTFRASGWTRRVRTECLWT